VVSLSDCLLASMGFLAHASPSVKRTPGLRMPAGIPPCSSPPIFEGPTRRPATGDSRLTWVPSVTDSGQTAHSARMTPG